MGGQLRTLLRADSLRALGRQVPAEPPEERGQDQRDREDDHQRGDQRVARSVQRPRTRECDQGGADHQRDPEPAAVEVDQPGAGGLARGRRRGQLGGVGTQRLARGARVLRPGRHRARLAPQKRRARRGEDRRPDQRVRPPEPELSQHQQQREGQEADADRDPPVPDRDPRQKRLDPAAPPRCLRSVGPFGRHEDPGEDVRGDRGAGSRDREGHHRDPNQERIDVEPPSDAGADAGEDAFLRVAGESGVLAVGAIGHAGARGGLRWEEVSHAVAPPPASDRRPDPPRPSRSGEQPSPRWRGRWPPGSPRPRLTPGPRRA